MSVKRFGLMSVMAGGLVLGLPLDLFLGASPRDAKMPIQMKSSVAFAQAPKTTPFVPPDTDEAELEQGPQSAPVSAVDSAFSSPDAAVFDVFEDLLGRHDRVQSARARLDAAGERVSESYSAYYPDLSVTGFAGRERRLNPEADNTTLNGRELSLSVTQRLYDFGTSASLVDQASLENERAVAVVRQVEEQVLLEGLAAHLGLARTRQVVDFASESVANINRQTALEDARVQRGGGFSTDVLQAQTQLVGAQARLVLAEGDLQLARNRYNAVFGVLPDFPPLGEDIAMPTHQLPASLEEAIATAETMNSALVVSRFDEALSRETLVETRSDRSFPKFDLVGEQTWSTDVEGVLGTRTESIIRLQLTYDFDLGFTLRNTIRAAESEARSVALSYADLLDTVRENVRNAWVQLDVTRQNAQLLSQQVVLAQRFLELAREERKAGRRSLIDVLAGETALINAKSDAISAELNEKVAAMALLATMGILDLSSLQVDG